ncbi:hypothetical protein I3843_11G114400 [Carya illinoinensis]|uniref:Uncharacterized protein n=1 Tax=Carya illinoinensis TaxID=32201 RepID=A0A8T1P6L8_CARIL|nr:hypothetical protein I3760_11G114000 [Carya illinoinensis]KAG6636510.1 hypothetical protein CIPAW_11G116300 [Carya illinoinensis]KAG6636511.1 hypothetical protein CIPAW_11G116300 [Carya illinoinensis]KAG6688269.1 hypothetical protein I3842_11G115600 [Carya illinoinensis]KAG7956240.1 hypothetical protein I3843_11G114400 [Carya illinoinensis]
MLSWIKAFSLILLLLLASSSSGRSADHGLRNGMKKSTYSSLEAMIQMKARKLIRVDALWNNLDYQDPIANPAHEPKKGGPGGKG